MICVGGMEDGVYGGVHFFKGGVLWLCGGG